MSEETIESKVIFDDDGRIRALRGVIIAEDDFFVTVERRDGVFKIAKRTIARIEQLNHGRDEA